MPFILALLIAALTSQNTLSNRLTNLLEDTYALQQPSRLYRCPMECPRR